MNRLLTCAALASLLSTSVPAFAGEANGEPFSYSAPGSSHQYFGAPVASATGAEALPQFTANTGVPALDNAGLFAGGGSDSDLGAVNSRPRGFSGGMADYAQAQSVQRYLQAQTDRAQRRFAQTRANQQARTLAEQVSSRGHG